MHAVSHRRAIRRSVLVTLAAWVFALMAGVANACLLHEHESGPQAQGQTFAHEATHAACDASDAAVVSVANQQARDGNPVDAAALQPVSAGPACAPVLSITPMRRDGVRAHGPPGAIRFLRLRL